jgi:hypothetical protein
MISWDQPATGRIDDPAIQLLFRLPVTAAADEGSTTAMAAFFGGVSEPDLERGIAP